MNYFKKYKTVISSVVIIFLAGFLIYGYQSANSLKKISLNIGGKNFSLEVASNNAERELGLGKRDTLGASSGMIFVFDELGNYGFWMKDTRFPLDIIWLNENCLVVGKAQMYPESFPKVFYPDFQAKYAIELPLNSAQGVQGGDKLDCNLLKKM